MLSIFSKIAKFFSEYQEIVNKNDSVVVFNAPWKSIDQLEKESFNPEKELLIVRFKNNDSQVYKVNYNPEKNQITNHWDENIKKERILAFYIQPLDSDEWSDEEPTFDHKRESPYANDFFVQIGDHYYQCLFLNIGNRHGIKLCFSTNEKPVYRPKRWIKTPHIYNH